MIDEIFLIEPEHPNRDLARKVAMHLSRSSFQPWDQIEVSGRRTELLGQVIEEIHRIGGVLINFNGNDVYQHRHLNYNSAQIWLDNYKLHQQTLNCKTAQAS